jgi:hypothetical protein
MTRTEYPMQAVTVTGDTLVAVLTELKLTTYRLNPEARLPDHVFITRLSDGQDEWYEGTMYYFELPTSARRTRLVSPERDGA